MKSVLKPVFESFCQIPADFKIIPWAPADIVALAKKAKKEFSFEYGDRQFELRSHSDEEKTEWKEAKKANWKKYLIHLI